MGAHLVNLITQAYRNGYQGLFYCIKARDYITHTGLRKEIKDWNLSPLIITLLTQLSLQLLNDLLYIPPITCIQT